MKKIEKLNMYVPDIKKSHYVAILNIANKVDELIDYLNQSPKQPEETEHIKLHKEVFCGVEDTPEEEYRYLDGDKPIKDKETIVFIEGLPERVWENTPEETERWEERLNNLKARLNGLPVVVEKEIDDIKEIVKQELSKAREEGRREYAHELLDDYYDPDRDSVEIDIDVLQKEFDLISNSEITSKQRQTEEILEEGYRIMAEDEARMKDEIALETYKQATTEKQEDWREVIKQMVLEDCFKDQPDIRGYIDFISQLLSERTFSKEELEWILSFIFGEGTRPRDGMGMKVLEKISKLLNEKEDEQI